jgi:hypothetical protein
LCVLKNKRRWRLSSLPGANEVPDHELAESRTY